MAGAAFPMPKTAAMLVGMTIAALVVTSGCRSSGDKPPATGTPHATPSTATFEQAVANIPLKGTSEKPIYWRPSGSAADLADPVLAARRAYALVKYSGATSHPKDLIWVVNRVTIGSIAENETSLLNQYTGNEAASIGPIWAWVMNAQRQAPDTVLVGLCVNVSWVHGADEPYPSNAVSEGGLQTIRVRQVRDSDGQLRWKADFWDVQARDTLGAGAEQQCDAWVRPQRPPGP